MGYSPWGHNKSDMTEQLHFHFIKGIAVSRLVSWSLTEVFDYSDTTV